MKRKNPSSDVPRARALLLTGLAKRDWSYVKAALPLMTRAKAVRRAKRKQGPITPAQKRMVQRIATLEPDTNIHEIANRTGVANGGRISEILTGKRR
jgi:hypothetical protein